jgi:hypothetical protein
MSAITTRPVVQSVQLVMNTGSAVLTAASVLKSTVQGLTGAAKIAYDRVTQTLDSNSTSIQSASVLKQQSIALQQRVLTIAQQSGLSECETIQVTALATAKLFRTNSPQILQQGMQVLQSNLNSAGLQAFDRQLLISHQSLFTQQLLLVAQSAAVKVGFKDVRVTNAPDGTVRAIASDDTGRTLITEIGTSIDRPPTLATEIIGSSDESCHEILDAYDRALEEAGVISGAPERKFTGGICELTAAKEFIRQPVKSKATNTTKPKTASHRRSVVPKRQNQQF